jgi:hypothetical protein
MLRAAGLFVDKPSAKSAHVFRAYQFAACTLRIDILVNSLGTRALTTITDFSVSEDRIHLTDATAFLGDGTTGSLTLSVQQTGDGTMLTVGLDRIHIKGLSPEDLVGAAIVDGFGGGNLYPLS